MKEYFNSVLYVFNNHGIENVTDIVDKTLHSFYTTLENLAKRFDDTVKDSIPSLHLYQALVFLLSVPLNAQNKAEVTNACISHEINDEQLIEILISLCSICAGSSLCRQMAIEIQTWYIGDAFSEASEQLNKVTEKLAFFNSKQKIYGKDNSEYRRNELKEQEKKAEDYYNQVTEYCLGYEVKS